MKKVFVSSFLLISAHCVFAQGDVKAWTRTTAGTSYDFGEAVATDNAGNIILVGETQGSVGAGGNAGRYDMFVAKYDSAGTRLWLRQRGSDQREFAFGVAADPSGNIYTTGYTGGSFDGNSHTGDNTRFDVFVMKHDASGNWEWTRQFGFNNDDEGRAIATDQLGNIYVAGYVRGALDGLPRPGTADVFIRKYNASGNKIWSALFGSPEVDEAFGITCDADGNIFVTGWCDGSIDGTPNQGNGDNFLAKYNPNGQQLWLKQWGTVNKDTGYSLATDADRNVYLSGYTTGTLYGPKNGERDVFLAKFDSAGNELWGRQFGTDGHDQGWGNATDPAGNVYVAGETSGPLDGNTYAGALDIFLTKYDPAGNWLWTTQYGTTESEISRGMAISTNGVYLGGWTYGSLDGNANQGLSDAFLTRFTFAAAAPPSPPVVKAASGVTSNAFTANWQAPGGATGYRLDVSTSGDFSTFLNGFHNLDVGNVTNKSVTGLTPTGTYFYRVRAYNTNGTSGNSGTVAVTLAPVSPCVSLLNPNFEDGFSLAGGGFIANDWIEWETDPGVVIGYNETVLVHGDAHSQRIRISGGTNGSSGGVYQRLPVVPGNTYNVSVWVYAEDDQSACYLGVDPTGGTNANVGVVWSSVTTNVAWVQKTWTGTPTAGLLTVYLKVASSDTTRRNGYFDDATPGSGVLPTLTIRRSGNSVTLTWPECPGAHLERADGLTSPVNWTTVTNQATITGGQKSVTLTPTGSVGFFRLVLE